MPNAAAGPDRLVVDVNVRVADCPVDKIVCKVDYQRRAAAAIWKFATQNSRLAQKIDEGFRIRRSERFINSLVGIAYANPVSLIACKTAKNLFLKPAAVLSFVFEDDRPPIAKPVEKLAIRIERFEREADEIIKVDRSAIAKTAFLGFIDSEAHVRQSSVPTQQVHTRAKLLRRLMPLLRQ